jgi:hypothetical protein
LGLIFTLKYIREAVVLDWIRNMAGIIGDVSIGRYDAGYRGNTRNMFPDLLCSVNQQALRELQLGHYLIKLLLLNVKKVNSFLTTLLNKCSKSYNGVRRYKMCR